MKISRFGLTVAAAFAVGVIAAPAYAQVTGGPFQYFAITPCRLADTRRAVGLNGGPVIDTTAPQRDFQVQGLCGVPTGAKAVSLNVTAVDPASSPFRGWFALWPSGTTRPVVSTINFAITDVAVANGAIVSLSANSSDLSAFLGGAGSPRAAHLVLDVTGYFQ